MSQLQEYHGDRCAVLTEDGYIEQHEGSFISVNMTEIETGVSDIPKTDYHAEINSFFPNSTLVDNPFRLENSRTALYDNKDHTVKKQNIKDSLSKLYTNIEDSSLALSYSAPPKATCLKKNNKPKIVKKALSHTIQCYNCGTKKTPLWRRTPDRLYKLCNACGLYYRQYKKHRTVTTSKSTTLTSLKIPDSQSSYLNIFKPNLIDSSGNITSTDYLIKNQSSLSADSSKSFYSDNTSKPLDFVIPNYNQAYKSDVNLQHPNIRITRNTFSFPNYDNSKELENIDGSLFCNNQSLSANPHSENMFMFSPNFDISPNQNTFANPFEYRNLQNNRPNLNSITNIDNNLFDINLKTEEIMKNIGVNSALDLAYTSQPQVDNILHFYSNYANLNSQNSKMDFTPVHNNQYAYISNNQSFVSSSGQNFGLHKDHTDLNVNDYSIHKLSNFKHPKGNSVTLPSEQIDNINLRQHQFLQQSQFPYDALSLIKDNINLTELPLNQTKQVNNMAAHDNVIHKSQLTTPLFQNFSQHQFPSEKDDHL
ncbi:hypothetical protein BB561_005032 [Smittium simulii]|uniref:GATA-type domain-containing protein n=1 Tax=Smittium simulii TaxID=133385 RepID=A0A2T9YCM8_9FUNG|nr:hypothetical protein BB561_005032 [Smittium simulii]